MAVLHWFSQIIPKQIVGLVWYFNTEPFTPLHNLWPTYHIAICVYEGVYSCILSRSQEVTSTLSEDASPPPKHPHHPPIFPPSILLSYPSPSPPYPPLPSLLNFLPLPLCYTVYFMYCTYSYICHIGMHLSNAVCAAFNIT